MNVRTLFSLMLCLAAVVLLATVAHGHGIRKSVSRSEAIVVELSYEDGTAFSNERYEIFREGETVAFQTGRTDALGRIVFVPDRAGGWRLRAFSEGGHGVDFTIENEAPAGAGGAEAALPAGASGRALRVVAGVFIIFGVSSAAGFYLRRRRSPR